MIENHQEGAATPEVVQRLSPALRDSFVPLPSGPDASLSTQQLDALFPGNRALVLREILKPRRAPAEVA